MWLQFFKALHIVGFVAWFAGIFYMVRLFVYHKEALDEYEPVERLIEQYKIMQRRLFYIITQPAMIITWIAGLSMIYLYGSEWFKVNLWLHYKLGFLFILTAYHFWMQRTMNLFAKKHPKISSFQFRLLNELPTLLLILIVFLAVFRSSFSLVYGLLTLVGLGVVFFLAARIYRTKRKG